jgi:flavin-dependent dehydrogenase
MLVVASRAEFDGRLLAAAQAAGATLLTVRVVDIARRPEGFDIETAAGRVRARTLVGADGANSLVRRRFARPFTRAELSTATGYFADGVTSDEIVLELTCRPPGYIWSFPRPTHLAIGICTEADRHDRPDDLRQQTMAWVQATGIAAGARGFKPYAWPIPSLPPEGFERLVVSGPGWYLVGDAAGLVDPLTREGIYYALVSAGWAAEALSSPADAGRRTYDARITEEIAGELARAARYKGRFFTSRFAQLVLDGVAASTAIRAVVADLVAGCQSYRGLKWRLLQTFEVGLAWKMLQSRS